MTRHIEEYVQMIEAFGLDEQKVYDRTGVQMTVRDDTIEPTLEEIACHNERREQEPISESPAPTFPPGFNWVTASYKVCSGGVSSI